VAILLALAPAPPAASLGWHGTPIHPGCIEQLTTDLADSRPVVAAVDVEGCQASTRYSSPTESEGAIIRWRDPEGGGRGYFQYEDLGTLASGAHVLRVATSGGGSGVFQSLLFVRLEERPALEDGHTRKRVVLELVGSETLGDRAQATVTLRGDVVTIRRRVFRGAAGPGPEETIERVVQ
jgi:hypothetical protein